MDLETTIVIGASALMALMFGIIVWILRFVLWPWLSELSKQQQSFDGGLSPGVTYSIKRTHQGFTLDEVTLSSVGASLEESLHGLAALIDMKNKDNERDQDGDKERSV